jgi:hypothetical protein
MESVQVTQLIFLTWALFDSCTKRLLLLRLLLLLGSDSSICR